MKYFTDTNIKYVKLCDQNWIFSSFKWIYLTIILVIFYGQKVQFIQLFFFTWYCFCFNLDYVLMRWKVINISFRNSNAILNAVHDNNFSSFRKSNFLIDSGNYTKTNLKMFAFNLKIWWLKRKVLIFDRDLNFVLIYKVVFLYKMCKSIILCINSHSSLIPLQKLIYLRYFYYLT